MRPVSPPLLPLPHSVLILPFPPPPPQDLDCPVSGLYAFRASLDERVAFLTSLLTELEQKASSHVPSSVR